jgi:hypothetical protein
MIKRMMPLALVAVSVAMCAVPALASAQEIHLEPGEAFTISGAGGEFRASGEPTITCTSTGGSGSFNAGSTTTGGFTLHITGCHTAVFGFTASCKSEGEATAGTVHISATWHSIKYLGIFPGTLWTLSVTKIVCAGISTITISGNVIGTITSPKCGESSKTVTESFTATGSTQNHLSYTGANYDLVAKTSDEVAHTAAWVGVISNTQASAGKLNCT